MSPFLRLPLYHESFLNKYILLSLAENDKNTVRIELLEKNPNVLRKSLEEIYARYKLLESTNREITKNALIGENYLNFISPQNHKSGSVYNTTSEGGNYEEE